MTTTELIAFLKKYEFGGATGKPYTIDPQTVPIKLNNKGMIDLVIAKTEDDRLGGELRRILWEMEMNNISLEDLLLNRRNTDNE